MAHQVDSMAWTGEAPWWYHGSDQRLGTKVTKGADIDTWIQESGLIWSVETADVAVRIGPVNGDGKPSWQPAAEHRAIYRSDTGKLFHIASERYKPVQPREVLEFFRGLAESHSMEVETCGSLREGAIVWALATNGGSIRVHGVDEIKPYLLLSTSMDGSRATNGKYVATRVVCNNTINVAWGEKSAGSVSVRHSTVFDADAVKARLGLSEEMAAFAEACDKLSNTQVRRVQIEQLLRGWFGQAKEKGQDVLDGETVLTTQSANVIQAVQGAIVQSPGQSLASAKGTAFGVLNGVTYYIDHLARARSNDNRLASAWFGRGDNLKSQAMMDLLKLAA